MELITLLAYINRFKEVKQASEPIRTIRLANLMTDLEGAYSIPLFGKERIEKFEQLNPDVMQLYRSVSKARVFSD